MSSSTTVSPLLDDWRPLPGYTILGKALIQNDTEYIFDSLNFGFPVFLTTFHLIFSVRVPCLT